MNEEWYNHNKIPNKQIVVALKTTAVSNALAISLLTENFKKIFAFFGVQPLQKGCVVGHKRLCAAASFNSKEITLHIIPPVPSLSHSLANLEY